MVRLSPHDSARTAWLLAAYDADQNTFVYARDILPKSVVLGLYIEDALVFQEHQLAQDTADRLNKIVSVPGGERLQPYKHELPDNPVRPRRGLLTDDTSSD